jgi:hypothetical protein
MKAQVRIAAFGKRIRGWLPTEPIMPSPPVTPGHRVTTALKSLGLAIGSAFVVLLAALFGTQAILGVANNAPFALFGFAILAAILFVGFSMRLFKCSASIATTKLARNAVIALVAGFAFTIATSSYYVSDGMNILSRSGSSFWFYFHFLMMGPLSLWAPVAFLVVTVFSFDYSRRRVHSP